MHYQMCLCCRIQYMGMLQGHPSISRILDYHNPVLGWQHFTYAACSVLAQPMPMQDGSSRVWHIFRRR